MKELLLNADELINIASGTEEKLKTMACDLVQDFFSGDADSKDGMYSIAHSYKNASIRADIIVDYIIKLGESLDEIRIIIDDIFKKQVPSINKN